MPCSDGVYTREQSVNAVARAARYKKRNDKLARILCDVGRHMSSFKDGGDLLRKMPSTFLKWWYKHLKEDNKRYIAERKDALEKAARLEKKAAHYRAKAISLRAGFRRKER